MKTMQQEVQETYHGTSKSSVLLQSPGRMFLLELYDSMINQHACSLQMVARLKMSQIR